MKPITVVKTGALRRHRPSKPTNAPVAGFLYFVLPETRMSRRWDMDCLPVPSHWKQVSLAEWLEFRRDTKQNYTAKHLRALAQLATLQTKKGK